MYLTEFLKKPVYDKNDRNIGKITDVIISSKKTYPKIDAIKVKVSHNENILIPSSNIDHVVDNKIYLTGDINEIEKYDLSESDLNLSDDILDRQVVDMEGRKIRRVNDIEISPKKGNFYIIGVDIGTNGLFRRMGLGKASERIYSQDNIIAWGDIDTLDYSNLKLKVPKEKLKRLHPADVADIVDGLGLSDSMNILNALDDELAADAFEEISPEKQKTILTEMEKKEAAELIDEMSPDDAADLLANIPERKKEEILRLMDPLESKELRELLKFPENTAGGIMTTEFAYINGNMSTKDTLYQLRKIAGDVETLYYVYVLSNDGRLQGVLSIRELFLNDEKTQVYEYMNKDYVSINLREDQYKVAKTIAKYNLIALPVLDDNNKMKGIITVDDAIDIVLPTAWKKRIPRMFR